MVALVTNKMTSGTTEAQQKRCVYFKRKLSPKLNQQGHPISAGTTGENILVQGIEIGEIQPGSVVRFPNVELVITQDAPPCKTIKESFIDGNFSVISHKKFPNLTRWYACVTKEGQVELNDSVEIIN